MNDKCISFNLDNNLFRGRIVRLDKLFADIFAHSEYPDDIAAAVAESTVLGVTFASLMKYDGLFTLQMQGNGAVSLLVTDVTSQGKVRSCAKYDAVAFKRLQKHKEEDEILAAPHWLGQGSMIFTVDQGKHSELYQGMVELRGKNMEECALRYFKQSEQIDTHLRLFTQKKDSGWQAAAVLIQKMPTAADADDYRQEKIQELWNEDKILTDSLQKEEIFNLDLQEVLFRLYHEHDVRVVSEREYVFGCRCNREKLLDTLSSMSETDIKDMIEDGKITATCNFCGRVYSFDPSELLKH